MADKVIISLGSTTITAQEITQVLDRAFRPTEKVEMAVEHYTRVAEKHAQQTSSETDSAVTANGR